MEIQMSQHPVGQCGLFCAELKSTGKTFRWVYDCGSNQHNALVREINVIAEKGSLDLLFLSHLDSDHVNGIDVLLSQCAVKEVVLPYLDDDIATVLIASDISAGKMSGSFLELVSDPAGWFGSRGVETITFVDGYDDDDTGFEGAVHSDL